MALVGTDRIELQGGELQGVRPGMVAQVYRSESAGGVTSWISFARLEITTVGPDVSWARIIEGEAANLQPGMMVEFDAQSTATSSDEAARLLQMGADAIVSRDYDTAVSLFDRLLSIQPDDPLALRRLEEARARVEEERSRRARNQAIPYLDAALKQAVADQDRTDQAFYARRILEVVPSHELAKQVRELAWTGAVEATTAAVTALDRETVEKIWSDYTSAWPDDERAKPKLAEAVATIAESERFRAHERARAAVARGDEDGVRGAWDEFASRWPGDQRANALRELDLEETRAIRTSIAPSLLIPIYGANEATKGLLVASLETGETLFVDRLRERPDKIRRSPLSVNVFSALSRRLDLPAAMGEILAAPIRQRDGKVASSFLVDTSSGAVARLLRLNEDPAKISIERLAERPAEALAADDHNYVLLMRRDRSGATSDAYLFHATTGRCLRFVGVGAEDRRVSRPEMIGSLPQLAGPISGVAVQADRSTTLAFFLIDGASGDVLRIEVGLDGSLSLPRTLRYNLFGIFPRDAPAPLRQRFIPIAAQAGSGKTKDLWLVDTVSGQLAALTQIDDPEALRLEPLQGRLFPDGETGKVRVWTAAAQSGSDGATKGVWLLDSSTERLLLLEQQSRLRLGASVALDLPR